MAGGRPNFARRTRQPEAAAAARLRQRASGRIPSARPEPPSSYHVSPAAFGEL